MSLWFTERRAALAVFILLVLPLVFFCACQVPTGQVPDEPTHVARVESVLTGQVIGHRIAALNPASGSQDAGVTGNFGLSAAAVAGIGGAAPAPFNGSAALRLDWARGLPWSPTSMFISSVNTAAYAPVAYVPAALGMGAAMALGAKPYGAIIGARIGNAIAFGLLGIAALAFTRRGLLLILVALTLPMTMWLAGSASQDGVVIAVTALGVALLTREGRTAFWCGCVALAVLALQKPPYLPLAVLPLLLGEPIWRDRLRRLPGAVLVALPGLLWSVAVVVLVAVPLLPHAPYHPGPLWPGDPSRLFHSAASGAQLTVLLHHPWATLTLPLRTAWQQCSELRMQFIGKLGVLTLALPLRLYALWGLAILSALFHLAARPAHDDARWTQIVATAAVLACAELIFLTLYLTWTPVGMERIDGVQGRYFIPLFCALVFVIPGVPLLRQLPRWVWWVAPVAAVLATGVTIPRLIAGY